MNIVLFEPDIPQNTGTILRMGACLDLKIHIIEPCGFVFRKENLKRYALDYLDQSHYLLHDSWETFLRFIQQEKGRLVLWTTKTNTPYWKIPPQHNDFYLFGSESAGVPNYVHDAANESVTIPMQKNMRSLNLATSVAFCAGEILKQRHQNDES